MKIILSFAILMLFTLISCTNRESSSYSQETRLEWSDFDNIKIVGDRINFDQQVLKPDQLIVFDSLLITINRGTNKIFDLYNLKNKKKIGERIDVGQGPEDMIMPYFIYDQKKIRVYDFMTSVVYSYNVNEFIQSTAPKPNEKLNLNETYLFSELSSLNKNLIGVSAKPDYPCYLFNEKGNKIKGGIGSYPIGKVKYTDLELVDAYRGILTSNGINRIALCHLFTDLIDIYDEKGQLVKRLNGPEHFFTRFKEFHDGDRIGSSPDANYYRDAFYSPINAGNSFFVLFNGRFVNKPGYNLLAKDVLEFSWDGVPLRHFELDKGVSRITVDTEKQIIYGISLDPEYCIIKYNY